MTTHTQLDAIIAAHLDPTSIEQFEAADRIAQAAYNLSLERIAELEAEIQGSAEVDKELFDRHEAALIRYEDRIDEIEAEADNARNLAIFLAGAWHGADSWIWEHAAHLEAVDKYPMMQGTANINRLKRIGKQPCDRVKAGKAIKSLLEDKEAS